MSGKLGTLLQLCQGTALTASSRLSKVVAQCLGKTPRFGYKGEETAVSYTLWQSILGRPWVSFTYTCLHLPNQSIGKALSVGFCEN